jgi:hypothetical protein
MDIPSDAVRPLTKAEAERIRSLLGIESEAQAQQIFSRIEIARSMFSGILRADGDHFNTRAVRDAAARELRSLENELANLRQNLGSLGPLATAQLQRIELREPKAWDGSLAFTLRYRGREWKASRLDAVELLPVLLEQIEAWSRQEVAWLSGPARSGRPRDFSGGVLVEQLAAIWEESTSRPLRSDLRGKDEQTQPFMELLQIVGKSVDRDFQGEGAFRRFYDLRSRTRKSE